MALMNPLDYAEWVDVYLDLVRYDLQLEGDEAARQILADQFREANRAFGKFIEGRITATGSPTPTTDAWADVRCSPTRCSPPTSCPS